jgi:hypothetical protein
MLVAMLNFLRVLKLHKAIRSEEFSELGDAHRQKSSGGAGSGDQYCCGCDTSWAHMSSRGGHVQILVRLRTASE